MSHGNVSHGKVGWPSQHTRCDRHALPTLTLTAFLHRVAGSVFSLSMDGVPQTQALRTSPGGSPQLSKVPSF